MSSGELVLIGFARAILGQSKIVVLEEVFEGLDIVASEKVENLLRDHFKDSTVFRITDRIREVFNCDSLIIMYHGKCIE
jgi:ABC-type multidrug transport system fused ATPase/permease subunit